jgi:chromosome segregation ATPase
MNENENVQDAQVIEKPVVHKDTAALEALRAQVSNARDDFKKQLSDVKDAIESREADLKNLTIRKHKLQGAIEASDLYLKPSTPVSK